MRWYFAPGQDFVHAINVSISRCVVATKECGQGVWVNTFAEHFSWAVRENLNLLTSDRIKKSLHNIPNG